MKTYKVSIYDNPIELLINAESMLDAQNDAINIYQETFKLSDKHQISITFLENVCEHKITHKPANFHNNILTFRCEKCDKVISLSIQTKDKNEKE